MVILRVYRSIWPFLNSLCTWGASQKNKIKWDYTFGRCGAGGWDGGSSINQILCLWCDTLEKNETIEIHHRHYNLRSVSTSQPQNFWALEPSNQLPYNRNPSLVLGLASSVLITWPSLGYLHLLARKSITVGYKPSLIYTDVTFALFNHCTWKLDSYSTAYQTQLQTSRSAVCIVN